MKKYQGYALITGGDMGIGKAFAEQLAEQGYDLLLVARNKEALQKTQEEITKKYGVKVLTLSQDLTGDKAVSMIMDFIKDQDIHVSLLVNNAGFMDFHEFKDSDMKSDIGMIELMCRDMVELTYALLPAMIEKGEGGIIINSSALARLHIPYYGVYSACKSFQESFGIILNFELESKNIDVLTVCPAYITTNFWNDSKAKKSITKGSESLIGFQPHSPEEVAQKSIKALGRKILIQGGNMRDRLFFYTTYFMPLKLERRFMQWYLRRLYNLEY